MIVLTILITTLYVGLIVSFIIGFDLIKPFKATQTAAKNSFSILIPFRNEAQELPALLKSIEQLNYPQRNFEILFIDDDSEDDSVAIIERFFASAQNDITIIKNIRKTDSPKKDAINTGILQSKYDWILTTDADCFLPINWLQTLDSFIQKRNSKLVVAPVTYTSKNTFLEQFQLLDFLSLMGSTIGGFGIKKPFLCNGANLCYSKQIFLEVNGFDGNSTIASGDDIFLLEKITSKYLNDVHYLKSTNVIVTTKPQSTVAQLISQRVRWAAKATAYKNNFSKLVGLSVVSMNFLMLLLFFGSIFMVVAWQITLFVFSIKFLTDGILLLKTTSFFKQNYVLKHYILSSLIYPFFTLTVLFTSFKIGYEWKGRQFKK